MKSIRKSKDTRAIRARLLRKGTSVPLIATKHGACVRTVYAVLDGTRSGKKTPEAQRAVEEIRNV